MNDSVIYWDEIYKNMENTMPKYDLWLDKFNDILRTSKDEAIIDLGCGYGGNTLYLFERNYYVISCDFSNEALNRVKKYVPNAKTINIDISNKLPFYDESTRVIVADLSLHYFDTLTTKKILKEIQRILKINGYLICRINSIKDINYGANTGREIEKNYYLSNVGNKRYFERKDIYYYFKKWKQIYCKEVKVYKYGVKKIAWELVFKKV